jgi:hypothetical protein
MVFSKWKGRNYVRQLVTPSNPQSALQVSTRAMMKFLSRQWATEVSTGDKATWLPLAAASAISTFNAYTSQALSEWTQFRAPAKTANAIEAGTVPTFTTPPAVSAGVRQATISWDINALLQAWGMLIFRSVTMGFTPSRDTLIGVALLKTLTTDNFIDTPVAPGVWYWNFVTFTDTGKKSASIGEVTGTVT